MKRARQAATGFFGVILFGVFACVPTFAVSRAAGKLVESSRRPSSPGYGIVQVVAENAAASPPVIALEVERSEGRLEEVAVPPPVRTASKRVDVRPLPAPSAPSPAAVHLADESVLGIGSVEVTF